MFLPLLCMLLMTARISAFTSHIPTRRLLPLSATPTYRGPILQDPNQIVSGICLEELGIDLAVAPSTIAPGTLGLYVILGEGVELATVPALSLLSGYSREGTFHTKDQGDKTVGFAMGGSQTAVFYERQPMSVLDALQLAAETRGNGACGLAGHVLEQNEQGEVQVLVDQSNPEFERYFVPALINAQDNHPEISVQNMGQYCNDLAWSYEDPPANKEEYDALSDQKNAVQLVWRLEFDEATNCLVPTWPVSCLQEDTKFDNAEQFMELGTRYGWTYWQASVNLEDL